MLLYEHQKRLRASDNATIKAESESSDLKFFSESKYVDLKFRTPWQVFKADCATQSENFLLA